MKYIYLFLIMLLTILILWINVRLHPRNFTPSETQADIVLQLNFLEAELKHNNLDIRMQQIYPEGLVFINALYGLTWCELALSDTLNDSNLKNRAISEALYAFDKINSEEAKWIFDDYIIPEYGIFYCGWKNYLLSKILSIDTTFIGSNAYVDMFMNQSDTIENALKNHNSPFLESYSRQSWPADMFIAMASLSNHDKIFAPKYNEVIDLWIQKVKERVDPNTLMIPHKVDAVSGLTKEGARGCSMSLMIRMLSEIDPDFANEQYQLFKTGFISTFLGLPSIREYPKGQKGFGDIDSGPVIFGVGFAATIVMAGTFSVLGQDQLSDIQYKTIHAFGFDQKTRNQKKYLFGRLPIADAFIAWGRASGLKYSKNATEPAFYQWALKFRFISFIVIMILWLGFFKKTITKFLFGVNSKNASGQSTFYESLRLGKPSIKNKDGI